MTYHTAAELSARIRSGQWSPLEIMTNTLERISYLQRHLNPFTEVYAEAALRQAREAERAISRHERLGALHGVPVSIKESIWLRGERATLGSLTLRDFRPAQNATVVDRLREAGAIVVAKTNVPEFNYSGYTSNQLFGLTRNPWDRSKTPGGSSGGAAASVAGGGTPISIGTDGGGSIRVPASFCGVVGHKPTFGLIPSGPGFQGWRTLTACGPITRAAEDAALCLQVTVDPHSAKHRRAHGGKVDYLRSLREFDATKLRIATSVDLGFAPVESSVRQSFSRAIKVLEAAGWKLHEAHPPTGDATRIWSQLALVEGLASDREFVERCPDCVSPKVRGIIDAGKRLSAHDYERAAEERLTFSKEWNHFFETFDLLLTPTMQLPAFPVDLEAPEAIDGNPVDPLLDDWCAFMYPVNLTGQPATTVPCGFDETGLPIGLQIIGRELEDHVTLAAAAAWQELDTSWKCVPDIVPPAAPPATVADKSAST